MRLTTFLTLAILALVFVGCGSAEGEQNENTTEASVAFEITNLSDTEYPDNPDIGFRASDYQNNFFTTGKVDSTQAAFVWDFTFYTVTKDTITLKGVDISEFIPTIPEHLKKHDYLSYISCINQEWNRNQVQFNPDEFSSNSQKLVRLDIARNCLNSYLWEIIVYVEDQGKVLPFAHGWFDFPHPLYARLFESKNGIPYSTYKDPLENWQNPESKEIPVEKLRGAIDSVPVLFSDESNQMYPLAGARKKKYKEIIYPDSFLVMRDLQSDSTLFATFTPPGFYNRKDPRKTELGRLYQLLNIDVLRTTSPTTKDTLHEIRLRFKHRDGQKETQLLLGGLNFDEFPVLESERANEGWKSSMGIGNHTFYEKYQEQISLKAANSSYYAMLLDGEGKWLDSHTIGVDGPIFHFGNEERTELHLWILSFERHALVGHYIIRLSTPETM